MNFKDLREFTQYIKGLPAGEKKITLRNISKVTTYVVQPPVDGNGKYLGGVKVKEMISRAEAESGRYIPTPESKVKLEEGTVFDLDDEIQGKDWEWVQYLDCIALTKGDALSNKHVSFYIELPEMEAVRKLGKFEAKKKAYDLVANIPTDELVEAAMSMGLLVEGYSPSQIRTLLYDKADSDAEKLARTLEDPDYAIVLTYLKAKKMGVIIYQDQMYRYGDITLGFTESQVKEFLKDRKANKEIVESIHKEMVSRSSKLKK